jgi:microcin C transport system permease protein
MAVYFLRRLLLVIPTFIGATFVVFMITRFVPGGPLERQLMLWKHGGAGGGGEAAGSSGAHSGAQHGISKDVIKQWEKQFHFDRSPPVAYFYWLGDLFTGNLGTSIKTQEKVSSMIVAKFPISLWFGLTGFLLSYLFCVPLGIAKALRHGGKFDFASSAIVFIGYSIPGWALGMLLLTMLASDQYWNVLPRGGVRTIKYENLPRIIKAIENEKRVKDRFGDVRWERLSLTSRFIDRAYNMMLPVFCYMIAGFATLTVLTKNSLMENLGQDYVRTAFAKGLTPRRVIFLHTLRNSLIPLATGAGAVLGVIMAGSYLIEYTFNIKGLGYLGYTSIVDRDYGTVMGILVFNTLLLLFGNILSDFLYALIDPRIRFD